MQQAQHEQGPEWVSLWSRPWCPQARGLRARPLCQCSKLELPHPHSCSNSQARLWQGRAGA